MTVERKKERKKELQLVLFVCQPCSIESKVDPPTHASVEANGHYCPSH